MTVSPVQPVLLRPLLIDELIARHHQDLAAHAARSAGSPIEVPATGTTLSTAYEQLRNAAEYAEEHLLLQRAIKRFYRLNWFVGKRQTNTLGRELIVELVQAGYLQNGSVGADGVAKLDTLFSQYVAAYENLRTAKIGRDTAIEWVLACLSVEVESFLTPHNRRYAVALFAYQYFLQTIDRDRFTDWPDGESYELCLYIAIHQALLKSDIDRVRFTLLSLYRISLADAAAFSRFNQHIDQLCTSELTAQLRRIVSRHGAPHRILKSLIDDQPSLAELLPHEQQCMDAYRSQITQEYARIQQRLNRGLIKSVIFIIITKSLIGISIEVPYDLLVHGKISWVPLGVNLLFPPVYMALLRTAIRMPSPSNTQALVKAAHTMLFTNTLPQLYIPAHRTISVVRQLLYTVLFAIPIAISVVILYALHFNILQMIIFFLFFSTASSLGFRLASLVRELEVSGRSSGFLTSLLDFFYLPFIMVGQWLSRKYSRLNIVARFLDVAIELPLKALLRLVRQWIRFLDERRESLY
jgi:hypothetical protein